MAADGSAGIFSWLCSYYCGKRWIHGTLKLRESSISFTPNVQSPDQDGSVVHIPLLDINSTQRQTTSIFYGAITFVVGNETHWFSSFKSRTDVINKLEYFKRELLLECTSAGNVGKNELLDIAYTSQNALAQSAKQLHEQGVQLDRAAMMVNTIHGDLNVADRIVDDLDSWLGIWFDKGAVRHPRRHEINRRFDQLDPARIEYDVLSATRQQDVHQPSKLVVSHRLMTFYEPNSKVIVEFMLQEISDMVAHSPFDMTVKRNSIGKADVTIHFITKQLVHVIRSLSLFCPQRISYEEPDESAVGITESRAHHSRYQRETSPEIRLCDANQSDVAVVGGLEVKHKHTGMKSLSESEATELSKVLMGMKVMATDIGIEQEKQLGQLDQLNDDTASATNRISKNRATITKLL